MTRVAAVSMGSEAAWRRRPPWGAIMMGAVTAIGAQFLFTAIGFALGFTAADNASAETIGVMAWLWWLVTGTLALMIGGLVLGRAFAPNGSESVCISAGAMWAVVALFGFAVIWSGTGAAATSTANVIRTGYLLPIASPSTPDWPSASAPPGNGSTSADPRATESVRHAARTASWWSVIGLVAGVAATWAGTALGARGLTTMPARERPPQPAPIAPM
jgi:hypothetical protein